VTLRVHGDALVAEGTLDFAVNVWPGPRAPALERALRTALEDARYPDPREATQALATRHGRSPAEVLALNGACEGFWLLAHALRPRLAACVHPSFTEPEAAFCAAGAEIVRVMREPERWSFDPREVPAEADLVAVCNPNNPTGNLDPAATLAALARPGRVLVVDESFMDFVPGEAESLAARRDLPGVVVLRSLTKLWSLAGIRAGYLLGPPRLVSLLAEHRQAWSVNGLACAALGVCAADTATPQRVGAEVAVAREELAARLARLDGIRVWPSTANFLLLRVPDGPRLVDGLQRAGISVRPAHWFPGLDDSYIRVAVRLPEENSRLVDALAEELRR
jgi:histidinol-phosphate aminotransferase